MHIILITPAAVHSRAGNRTTAIRWARILESLGHHVQVETHYQAQDADLMIALHAWRSAPSIRQFSDLHPDRPLIVALTGTDAYGFIHSHPDTTLESIAAADYLVGLHDLIGKTLPQGQRHKIHVIYQSARPIPERRPHRNRFHVSVLGHLREEKDPLRPALAARQLPDESRIEVHHYGKAHAPDWEEAARAEMAINPRYTWHGEIRHSQIRQVYARTNLAVLPSRMEGGANVISEAIVAGVPVVTSHIEGSVGLLGADYEGYYPVGDEGALAQLLIRLECDSDFYQRLEEACLSRQSRFTPERETRAWEDLLRRL